jgi:uncharacterized protein
MPPVDPTPLGKSAYNHDERMSWKRLVASAGVLGLLHAEINYRATIEQWRSKHESELKADNGWLTVAGLFWLKEGSNTIGTGPSSNIVLPRGPAKAGIFEFRQGHATFEAAPGVAVLINGKPPRPAMQLKADTEGSPDQVQLADLTMFVIHRGDRFGIRLKDPASEQRRKFTGLHWFPVNESYRVKARFMAYDKPRMIPITNVLGETEPEASPGYVSFMVNGRALRLEPVAEGDQLFFIFRDLTAGRETYPAGRFLYSDLPKNGEVELDFNKAENPPCAFTPFATCPLPPKQNWLAVRVEAGELTYGH